MKPRILRWGIFILAILLTGCSGGAGTPTGGASSVPHVKSADQLDQIISSAGDRLLMLDFYADWCAPCRELSPLLEELAREHPEKVTVYKVNVDEQRDLARSYRVDGIPYVVFIKDQSPVFSLTGLHTKESYVKVIRRY